MPAPHIPTAAQLTQLAALQATAAAAKVTLDAILGRTGTLAVAHEASLNAQKAVADYTAYIYGGRKSTVWDEGSQNTV